MAKEFSPEERQLLTTIGNNLTVESLRILAQKSQKKGINEKLKQYAYLI